MIKKQLYNNILLALFTCLYIYYMKLDISFRKQHTKQLLVQETITYIRKLCIHQILMVTFFVSCLPKERMPLSSSKGNGKTPTRVTMIYIKS